jgi:hypothetical protein
MPSSSSYQQPLPPISQQLSKKLSPWFPSVPASLCQGIFQFTIDGTAYIKNQHLTNQKHNITLQITSTNQDSIAAKLWIDRNKYNDDGIDFNIKNIADDCKYLMFNNK